jgi:hypothetical protein
MIYKVLRIDDEVTENSLTVGLNQNGKIFLEQPDENEIPAFIITLSKDEAVELASELKRLAKLL